MTGVPANAAKGWAAIGAASLLTLVFGSVHAFSVLLAVLEHDLAVGRAAVSLTYSLALASLTLAVLTGHRVYTLARPPLFVAFVAVVAVSGLLATAMGGSLASWWVGYGMIFGSANGLAYGYGLQLAAQANPDHPGLAIGLVTAAYALGASLAAPALATAAVASSPEGALVLLAAAIALASAAAALILKRASLSFQAEPQITEGSESRSGAVFAWWLGYGLGVSAGLMTASQAAGMAAAAGLTTAFAVAATAAFAIANMAGGLAAGWAADRLPFFRLLTLLPLVALASALVLVAECGGVCVLAGIAGFGASYGAIIALYPAAVAARFGVLAAQRVYGRVFTAWGLAGLCAPLASGALFETTGSYAAPLVLAALLSAASSVVVYWFRLGAAGVRA